MARLTAEIPSEAAKALKALAAQQGVTRTEMLRRVLSIGIHILRETEAGNGFIREDLGGNLTRIFFRTWKTGKDNG